jgi:hypothetical protein
MHAHLHPPDTFFSSLSLSLMFFIYSRCPIITAQFTFRYPKISPLRVVERFWNGVIGGNSGRLRVFMAVLF